MLTAIISGTWTANIIDTHNICVVFVYDGIHMHIHVCSKYVMSPKSGTGIFIRLQMLASQHHSPVIERLIQIEKYCGNMHSVQIKNTE